MVLYYFLIKIQPHLIVINIKEKVNDIVNKYVFFCAYLELMLRKVIFNEYTIDKYFCKSFLRYLEKEINDIINEYS